MRTIGRDFGDTARKVYAVASGALGNGKAVVVNSDGTVSVVSGTAELNSTLQVVPNDNCQSQRCKDGTIVQRYIDIERRYMAKYYLKFSVYLNLNK